MKFYKLPQGLHSIVHEAFEHDQEIYISPNSKEILEKIDIPLEDYEVVEHENNIENVKIEGDNLTLLCGNCNGSGSVLGEIWSDDPKSGNHVAGRQETVTENCFCSGGVYLLNV